MDVIGILGIVIGVIIALIPYFISKYFSRPELTIDIVFNGGMSLARGLSSNNDFSKGYVEGETANRLFELTWDFDVIITNNSDKTAFYPEIEFNPSGPKFTILDKLNRLQPIQSAESLTIKAKYKKYEEVTGQNRTDIGQVPPSEFGDLALLLGYENSNKMRFFTLFNYSLISNKNRFIRKKPKDYNNN